MENEEQIRQLIEQTIQRTEESSIKDYTKEDIKSLKQIAELFSAKHLFRKGEIVKWKKDLKNRRLPKENQPAIVLDILNPPVLNNEKESGSTYFQEPLDIVLGFIDEADNDFMIFHYDSRRFQPYE